MTGNSHLVVGTGLTLATLHQAQFTPQFNDDWPTFMTAVAVGALASLLPDGLDSKNSKLKTIVKGGGNKMRLSSRLVSRKQRCKPTGAIIYIILSAIEWVGRSLLGFLLDVISTLIPHRGPSHYVSTALLLTGLVWIVSTFFSILPVYAFAFGVGYLSHIWADSMTRSGVKLFGPLTQKTFHSLPFALRLRTERTANITERIAVAGILLLAGTAFVVPTAKQYLILVSLVVIGMFGFSAVDKWVHRRNLRQQVKA